jgi:hypothetical protein
VRQQFPAVTLGIRQEGILGAAVVEIMSQDCHSAEPNQFG